MNMNQKAGVAFFGVVLLLVAVFFGAYYSDIGAKHGKNDSPQRDKSRTSVSLRLNWIPDPTFSGAYIAKARGYWASRGLDVSVNPGGQNRDPLRLVATGEDDFGVVGANRLLLGRDEGMDLVAIALIMPEHPVGWIVRKDSKIQEFADLKGKRIGQKVGDESDSLLEVVLSKCDLSTSDVELVPVSFSPEPFLVGDVDAFPVYMNEEPHTVAAQGIEVRVLRPAALGIELYGNVLFTSRTMIDETPELVREFVQGYLDGWKAVMTGDATRLATELVQAEPDMGRVPTELVLRSTIDLVRRHGADQRFGAMSVKGWRRVEYVLARKDVEESSDTEFGKVFTNAFINEK